MYPDLRHLQSSGGRVLSAAGEETMHRRSPQTADSRSTSAATTPGRHARAWLVWPEDDSGRCWTVEAPTASDAIMDAVPRLTAHAVTVLEVTADAVTICAEDYSATIRAARA